MNRIRAQFFISLRLFDLPKKREPKIILVKKKNHNEGVSWGQMPQQLFSIKHPDK